MNEGSANIESRLAKLRYDWEPVIAALHATLSKAVILDISTTVLPIGVIYMILRATNGELGRIMAWPEWSFASIVLYGVSISKLIELKTRRQNDLSHRLDAGARFFALLLVFSVITLSVAILSSRGVAVNVPFLEDTQFSLFLLSLLTVVGAEVVGQIRSFCKSNRPWTLPPHAFYGQVLGDLRTFGDSISFFCFALDKANRAYNSIDSRYYGGSAQWTSERRQELISAIEDLELSTKRLKLFLSNDSAKVSEAAVEGTLPHNPGLNRTDTALSRGTAG